jgi:ClpX C4-type zinc finger
MVAGPRGVHICHECVDLCNYILSQLEPQPPETFRWADLVDQQPALGALAGEKLLKPGVLLVGTARRDASARISGVEPLVMDGELWLASTAQPPAPSPAPRSSYAVPPALCPTLRYSARAAAPGGRSSLRSQGFFGLNWPRTTFSRACLCSGVRTSSSEPSGAGG